MDFVQAANTQRNDPDSVQSGDRVYRQPTKNTHVRQDTYTPTTTTATSASEEETETTKNGMIHITNFDELDDTSNIVPESNVSADQIYSKFHEYDLIENQLAKVQEQGMLIQAQGKNDKKQLKRQIKQIAKNTDSADETSTDEYKELSSTTNSDELTNDMGGMFKRRLVPWYKDGRKLMIGFVGIGIVSFALYKYVSKSNAADQFEWLQNRKRTTKNSGYWFGFW